MVVHSKITRKSQHEIVGDDLPHMPQEAQRVPAHPKITPTYGNSSAKERTTPKLTMPESSAPVNAHADGPFSKRVSPVAMAPTPGNTWTAATGYDASPCYEKMPAAMRADNAVLVDRELQRLRERRPFAVRRRWRIITGASMLVVLALTAYVMAQSIKAFLSLSPATWVLSDAQDGTQTSPDPLLRQLALVEVVASCFSTLVCLISGMYLRMTRRRSCGRRLIWLAAILTTTINVALSLINVALVAGWHRKYAKNASDPLAHTRDVGQRCAGSWDMDILWSAAESSVVAKPGDNTTSCPRDPQRTTMAYLVAGGVRLAVFVILSATWLSCLARYNRSLALSLASDETIEESPEMHNLLADEGHLPAMPELKDIQTIGSSDIARHTSKDTLPELPESGDNKHWSAATLVGAPPTLSYFGWQRDPKVSPGHDDSDTNVLSNVGRHERDESAGAWSAAIMHRLWGAIRGEGSTANARNELDVIAEEKDDQVNLLHIVRPDASEPLHGREKSQLGVRGWFRRTASATNGFSDDESDQSDDDEYEEVLDTRRTHMNSAPHGHQRVSSQERRQREGRHAAVRQVYAHDDDPYTTKQARDELAHQKVRERVEARKRAQQERIIFLAGIGCHSTPRLSTSQPLTAPSRDSHRDSISLSRSETLQHMPELQQLHASNRTSVANDDRDDDDDERAYWVRNDGASTAFDVVRPSDVREKRSHEGNPPVFVRTLGKLVRQLSAIESVGSGEMRSASRSRDRSASTDIY